MQLHAHWGDKSGHGSEHTLDGESFDAELHIVHYNTKYENAGEAFDKDDGLAVLGIFLSIGEQDHPEFEKICNRFVDIENAGDNVALDDEIDLNNLLPENKTFFTYPGSLTTPPLFESVTWIVFKQELRISQRQVFYLERKCCFIILHRIDIVKCISVLFDEITENRNW